MAIIFQFGSSIKNLVDLATTISFMIAPFIAFANYKLVSKSYLKEENTPQPWLKYLAIGGILYLVGFGTLFIYVRAVL
jgi:Mn2+/Fe2+ NRAMP family transporter